MSERPRGPVPVGASGPRESTLRLAQGHGSGKGPRRPFGHHGVGGMCGRRSVGSATRQAFTVASSILKHVFIVNTEQPGCVIQSACVLVVHQINDSWRHLR